MLYHSISNKKQQILADPNRHPFVPEFYTDQIHQRVQQEFLSFEVVPKLYSLQKLLPIHIYKYFLKWKTVTL